MVAGGRGSWGRPTRDMVLVQQKWQQSPCFPRSQFTLSVNFLKQIQGQRDYPVWKDELYLKFHRGCYTTHSDQKQANRRSEQLLYSAEFFATIATLYGGQSDQGELTQLWQRILFNQFHDILPGTSIPEVFVDANQDWAIVAEQAQAILTNSLKVIAHGLNLPCDGEDLRSTFVVFNDRNWSRSALIELPGSWSSLSTDGGSARGITQIIQTRETIKTLVLAEQVPGCGYRTLNLTKIDAPPTPMAELEQHLPVLENEFLRVEIDPQSGEIKSMVDRGHHREVLTPGLPQLLAYQDQGQYWDAWNIDPNYREHCLGAPQIISWSWQERGPLRQRLRVIKQFQSSHLTQDYILETHRPYLEIKTDIDWQETHVLLQAHIHLNFAVTTASYEIPYGVIDRDPTNPDQWEVPALHWASVTDGHHGFTLLNDGKYGHSVGPKQINLSLLRSPTWPDPHSDRGRHQFSYFLYPHLGPWQQNSVVHLGHELQRSLSWVKLQPSSNHDNKSSARSSHGQFFNVGVEGSSLILTALKRSEDRPNQWVIRCYETYGQETQLNFASPFGLQLGDRLNILEQAIEGQNSIVKPWEIANWHLNPSRGEDLI
ncbi:MAG: alpha-mannosidase [Synechococcaceae cyanobacterium RL_1_2]|nr:alpha-mannosidase [Synechococcaceae cyanobacterium RL_1_2]